MITYTKLKVPASYQGGKQRLASAIADAMAVPADTAFLDLCCGSGAVSLELISRGHDPNKITMVDQSPWGYFWQSVGTGTFDMAIFRTYCEACPTDQVAIKKHIEYLYNQPVDADAVYVFLLLQAASFGSKPIYIVGNRWLGYGFRDYWLPTETSSRRSPVTPMHPMPYALPERLEAITTRARGILGICGDASGVNPCVPGVAYLDPGYVGTTGYPYSIDVVAVARRLVAAGCPCWVSESHPLTDHAVCLSTGRLKGGITGNRKVSPNQEWLSLFPTRMDTV